MLVPTPTVSM